MEQPRLSGGVVFFARSFLWQFGVVPHIDADEKHRNGSGASQQHVLGRIFRSGFLPR
jgi:hypothetical protein